MKSLGFSIAFCLAFGVAESSNAQAGPILKELAKTVATGVLTTAANASIASVLETKPVAPTALDRVRIKEVLDRMDYQDEAKRKRAFADKVDFLHFGVVSREFVFKELPPSIYYARQCESIENVEMDPKGNFVVVSYTEVEMGLAQTKDGRTVLDPGRRFKRVALIGDWKKNPKVYALKNPV